MDKTLRLKIEKNLFLFSGLLLAMGSIVWTKDLFGKFLNLGIIGIADIKTILAIILLYCYARYFNHQI